ncbi:Hypothetical protein, putative [Bodo saltans]|uniref:Uncharacterized protein n=1 Tax=Bodo saltans TaxID=75058 RepID=A0A0S4IPY8_BODSA|nr:Hypothetical protein, putative [Bodo saltans]|eukprot:CUE72074.1 Hypothetical protein, putative [Bodo saltans]
MSGPIIAEVNRLKRLDEAKKIRGDTTEPSKVLLSELPFDPTIGAEQLAHAKQRIRDQRHQIVHLEGHLEVLNDAMARRQDILDYVKQMILHDAVFMSCIPDDSKRSEYQKNFLSILDGDHLHGLSAAVERGLLEEQLNALRDRVRMLDARDATKSKTIKEKDQKANAMTAERDALQLQISKSKNQYTNLYKVLQETKEDLTGSRDAVSQIKREADMLRKTLDSALVDLKQKEQQLATAVSVSQSLQGQLDAMSNQSDADKRAASEAMKSVTPLSCDILRSAEQATNAKFGTSLWSTYMQVSSDTLEKFATVLQAASGNNAAEQLKNVVKSVSLFHAMAKASFDASVTQQSQQAAQEGEWQMSCDVKSGLVPSSEIGLTIARAKGILGQLSSTSPCTFAPVEKLFQSLVRLSQGLVSSWESDISAQVMEADSLRKELQDVQSRQTATVEVAPAPSPAEAPVHEVLLQVRTTLDDTKTKWFAPNVKSWADEFDETIGSAAQSLGQYRLLEKPLSVPFKTLECVVEAMGRLLTHVKAGKRDIVRRNQLAEEKEKDLASRESSPLPVHHPQADPALPSLLTECHETMQAVQAAQATVAASINGDQFIEARKVLREAIRKAVDACEGTVVGDTTIKAQQLFTLCVRCIESSFTETEFVWLGIVSIDDPAVAQCTRSGQISAKLGGSWGRIMPPIMAAELQRNKNGATSLTKLSEPAPPPRVVEKAQPPAVPQKHNSTQTVAEKAVTQKPLTPEQAIDIVKKAGMWPSVPSAHSRTVGSDESIQATSQAFRRGTQTPHGVASREDSSTMTDTGLLTQFFGLSNGASATKGPPLQRQRSASVVQLFGATGELEDIGTMHADDHAPLMRTASSIPTKHRTSVDLTVSAARSHSFVRKHSISALLAREKSISVQRDVDDDSVESVVYGSDFGETFAQETSAPQGQARRSSAARIFTADFGDAAPEAPADFYALLGNRRPSTATLERPASALLRGASSKSLSLRERSEEVKQIAGAIGSRRQSVLQQRNQKINEVIMGDVTPAAQPTSGGDTRRKSLRELATTQRHMAAVLQGNKSGNEES